ncbi:MAG: hypothetical protein FWD14_06920, partial [Treponema sp.]|nr:hypothetical protein [Treponema sp.]
MRKLEFLGIIALVAIIGFSLLTCKDPSNDLPDQTPVAGDFEISNLSQTAGSVTAAIITPKTDKSTGAITIFYNGSTTLPTAVDTYSITFDVAATSGWNAANGLDGGSFIINQSSGTFGNPLAINTTYSSTLRLVDLTLPVGYVWNAPTTSLNAGDGQQFPATYTDPSGNYTTVSGFITVNISKAIGIFGLPSSIDRIYTPTLTLSNLILPTGYTWNIPTTGLNAGIGQQFPATYTDPSGNYESVSGNITVNIAKAVGIFGSPAAINITYASTLTLGNLSLPTGYVWNAPTTNLNVGNGQFFSATFTDSSGNYEPVNSSIRVNVSEVSGNFPALQAIDTTYIATLRLSNLILPVGYTWNSPTTILNAGNGQLFAATYTDPSGNFAPASGNITVNVARATGTFGTPSAINRTYTSGLTLACLTLPVGYTWNIPTTNLNAGDGQSFPAIYTNSNGNYEPVNGNITVNIARATGVFGNPDPINTIYSPTLTLANLTLPAGYTWNTPTTILNANNGQFFSAIFTDPSGNYTTVSGNIQVFIARANGADAAAPTMASRTINSITINPVTAPTNGQTIEYARNTVNTTPVNGWQDSTTFSGLTSNTTYYIFARV